MTRGVRFSLIALGLLTATGVAAAVPSRTVDTPLRASLEAIPAPPGWRVATEAPETILRPDGRAPYRLTRGYRNGRETEWVLVEYFPAQDETRRAAAREFVFPAQGWSQMTEREVALPLGGPGGGVPANLVLMEMDKQRYAILYWYEIGGIATLSDHGYRVRLLYNQLVRGRSDGALIRIASPLEAGEDGNAALARQTEFLRVFYPALLRSLPR
jgi:EpsI family protein